MQKQKVTRIFAPAVSLILEVDGQSETKLKLELSLAWTMKGVILLEQKLRNFGISVNVLQSPDKFWKTMDCTMLTTAVWAMSQQQSQDYADEAGFELIASFLTADNFAAAAAVLQEAFLQSLSDKRRKEIEEAVKQAEAEAQAGVPKPEDNPTVAPVQS